MKFNKFMYGLRTLHKPIVYDNETLTFSTTINWVKQRQKKKTQKWVNIIAKIKRYRDKMKMDTDIYEQMQKKEYKENDIAMLKETQKRRKPVHPIKEMNEKLK